jgi:hypothetical protein
MAFHLMIVCPNDVNKQADPSLLNKILACANHGGQKCKIHVLHLLVNLLQEEELEKVAPASQTALH